MGELKVMVMGAAGFLGQRIVLCALERGHEVVAAVRPGTDLSRVLWHGKSVRVVDTPELTPDMRVIHAAGALKGDDQAQGRDTIEPTRRLVDAMVAAKSRRLVLISSLSVYGVAHLPDGS